jgi:hypothetical protein
MPAGDFESIRKPEGDEKRARLEDWARLGNGLFHLRRMAGFGPPGLYDLLQPHVTKVVVCDPRKNVLLKRGNQCDRSDARKLTELLPAGLLSAVYHGRTRRQAFRPVTSQLSGDQQRPHEHHGSAESSVPKSEHSLGPRPMHRVIGRDG